MDAIKEIVTNEEPLEAFKMFAEALYEVLPTRLSKKHMAGRDLGRIEPTPSLASQNAM